MSEFRALLMTDVVDSTALSEGLGDLRMAALWDAHDRVSRQLLREWRGSEIDRSDGFLLLFDTAADALGFALAYHRALEKLEVPLQARAGLHFGPVILRRNHEADIALGAKPLEVEGAAKPTAARVMSVALGGQTLLSAQARMALGTTAAHVESHGHWRLRGIGEPIELFEAGDEPAPFTPPPDSAKAYRVVRRLDLWVPLREVRHSLPAERDAFVGRHEPLLELSRRFDAGARLVAVLGMGGTGKTRLVTRFGWNWLGDFPGGVWFCDLSQARNLDGIASAVAQGLDMPLDKDEPIARLGMAIAGRGQCLVILDNFEQVSRHAEETLGRWLDMASEARFLVTTREVLGTPGEQTCALAPLPGAEAIELFMRRARAARSDLQLGAEDEAAIPSLVKLLDGLPLAIELAAARVRVMAPRVLLARMSERFRLLASTGGRQDRQATLRATFDWSWDLLTPAERSALAQLSAFEGGFTLEAVEAMLDVSAVDAAPWTVDLLQSLVDKSFVRPVGKDRFELLNSVQVYAAEHLATEDRFPGSGVEAQQLTHARHGAWFAALGPRRALEGACADLANLVIACRRAVATGRAQWAGGALQGAWAALSRHGPFSSGLELAQAVCELPDLDDATAAGADAVCGRALDLLGQPLDARRHYEIALTRAPHSRGSVRPNVLTWLAALDGREGRMSEARAGLAMALDLARSLDDTAAEIAALNGLASVEFNQGGMEEARLHYEAALRRAHEVDDAGWQCSLLSNLGMLHANVGRMDDAHVCLEQSLALARRTSDRRLEGNNLCNLGMLHLVQQHLEPAIEALEQALQVARDLGHLRLEHIVQCNLGLAQEAQGHTPQALACFDAALGVVRALGDRRSEGQYLGYLGRTRARLREFDHARDCFAAGQALLRELADPLSLGILQCDRAVCEWHAGDATAARAALDEASAIAHAAGTGPESELGQSLTRVQVLLSSAAKGPSVSR